MGQRIKALYISYNGVLEPLMHSQGIPYLKLLTKNGIDFTLLSFEKRKQARNKKRISEINFELSISDIDWNWLHYHKLPSFPATLWDIILGIINSSYIIARKKISIVHARGTVAAAIAFFVSKIFKIKFIFDMRGLLAEEYVDGGNWKKQSWKYHITKKLEKSFLIHSDRIIVLTHRIKQILQNDGYLDYQKRPSYIEVIPCCADLEKFKPKPKNTFLLNHYNLNNKFIFIYVGSLGTWYLLYEMIDFFKIAKEKIPNAHMLLLTQTDNNNVVRAILDLGLMKSDFLVTQTSPKNVPNYISLADVGIFFIKPCFSKLASSPTKLGEYLACGKPVVINRVVGDTEQFVKSYRIGSIVHDFKKEYYEEAINQLKTMMKEGSALKERCRKIAETYLSLEDAVQSYWRVYKSF